MTPRVELVPFEGATGLAAQRPIWEELLDLAQVHRVFNGPEWVLAWTQAFAVPEALFGWTARDAAGVPVAFIALAAEPRESLLDPRRAALATAGTWDTDYRDLLVRPGWEAPVAEALLETLSRRRATDALFLPCVRADSPVLSALREAAERHRLLTREIALSTMVADLAPDLAGHLAGLRPRVRTKLRGALRKAEQLGAHFQMVDDAARLDDCLDELFELHNARWRAAGESGSFADPRRLQFYRAIAPRLLERGQLRLSRLELDGKPLALQFGFVSDSTYHQLQEGYDPEYADARVGIALRAMSLDALAREGVRRYDFLAGAARHKAEWGAQPVDCVDWACALPGMGGARGRLLFWARARARRQGGPAE